VGAKGDALIAFRHRIELTPPVGVMNLGYEAHEIEAKKGIALDAQEAAGGRIRVDQSRCADVDGEERIGDAVDRPGDGPPRRTGSRSLASAPGRGAQGKPELDEQGL
jgi:hypothetical protein